MMAPKILPTPMDSITRALLGKIIDVIKKKTKW